MGIPSEAGELIVDLRRVGTFRHQRLVFGGIFALLGLVVAGDPSAWPVLAVYGGIAMLTWLILTFIGSVRAVCERGVVVRSRWSHHVVPWTDVRGLHQRRVASRGGPYILTFVETDGRAVPLPRSFGRRGGSGEIAAAIRAIEERANVKLALAPPAGTGSRKAGDGGAGHRRPGL